MTHLAYDSSADIRLVERSQLAEGTTSARRQAIDLFGRIASLARDIDSLSTCRNSCTAEEMAKAVAAIDDEMTLTHEHIVRLKAAIRDMQQNDELMKGL